MTVMIDSGFRRGTDVLKALALGAQWSSSAGHFCLPRHTPANPVRHAISLLAKEIDRTWRCSAPAASTISVRSCWSRSLPRSLPARWPDSIALRQHVDLAQWRAGTARSWLAAALDPIMEASKVDRRNEQFAPLRPGLLRLGK